MVNLILNSISKSLYSTFGDSYHYYVEGIEQNAIIPCFTLSVLNPLTRSVNHKDYHRTIPCVIHYFTGDKRNSNKDCYLVGEQVLECLEYLSVDGNLIRAEDMSYTMVDDVLQIFLTYRFWTEKPDTTPTMEDINIQSSSKVN